MLGLGSAQLTLVALASLIAVMTIRVMPTLGGVLVASVVVAVAAAATF